MKIELEIPDAWAKELARSVPEEHSGETLEQKIAFILELHLENDRALREHNKTLALYRMFDIHHPHHELDDDVPF